MDLGHNLGVGSAGYLLIQTLPFDCCVVGTWGRYWGVARVVLEVQKQVVVF